MKICRIFASSFEREKLLNEEKKKKVTNNKNT